MKTVSACILLGPDEPLFQKCLKSVSIWVDEVIVINSDPEYMPRLNDKRNIKYFNRPFDDFASARNYSIGQSNSDYIFIIDSDEILERSQIKPIKYLLGQSFEVIYMKQKSKVGKHYTEVTQPRLFKNVPSIYYNRPVHNELKFGSDRMICYSDIRIMHYGYDLGLKQVKKQERTLSMLEDIKNPDTFDLYNLMTTHAGMKNWEEAIETGLQVLSSFKLEKPRGLDHVELMTLNTLATAYLKERQDPYAAAQWCIQLLEKDPNYLDGLYTYAWCFFLTSQFDGCIEILNTFDYIQAQTLKNPDNYSNMVINKLYTSSKELRELVQSEQKEEELEDCSV